MTEPGSFLLFYLGISVVSAIVIGVVLLVESARKKKLQFFDATARLKGHDLQGRSWEESCLSK